MLSVETPLVGATKFSRLDGCGGKMDEASGHGVVLHCRNRADSTPSRPACSRVSVHVRILWTTLSVMVTAGCTYSFTQPAWYIHSQTKDALGFYSYCVRDSRTTRAASGLLWSASRFTVPATATPQLCGVYGGQFDLSSLPSNAWQIACVLYGGGCVLLGFASLSALVCVFLPSTWSSRLACYTGYIQTMAAVILIGAVVAFPVGLDSKFAQHYCPGARMYDAGSCSVGWAYILGIMASALVIFCPILAQYTDIDDDDDDVILNPLTGSSTVRLI